MLLLLAFVPALFAIVFYAVKTRQHHANWERYSRLIGVLRTARRRRDHTPEQERVLLLRVDELFDKLCDEDQCRARSELWKADPGRFDAHLVNTFLKPSAMEARNR